MSKQVKKQNLKIKRRFKLNGQQILALFLILIMLLSVILPLISYVI